MALQAALAEGNDGDAAIVREPQYLRYLVPVSGTPRRREDGVVVGEDTAPVALDLSPVVANKPGSARMLLNRIQGPFPTSA